MKTKKILSAITALCLIGGTAPTAYHYAPDLAVTANAATDYDGNEYNEVTVGYLTFNVYEDHAEVTGCSSEATGEIDIPSAVNGIPVTGVKGSAFDHCSITSINAPVNSAYFKSIDGVLFDKSGSTLIAYPGGKTDTSYIIPDPVTIIGTSAFSACTNLTSITIPDSVTEIRDSAFFNCTKITSVSIPDSVTVLGDSAFCHCTSLKSVKIGNGVTELPGHRSTGGWTGVFGHCENLESVEMGDSIEHIGEEAFYLCSSLSEIKFSKNIRSVSRLALDTTLWYENQPDGLIYIGKCAYKYKGDMPENTSVAIKDGTLGIGDHAFLNQKDLVSVTLPDSLKEIGSYAFSSTGIEEISIPDSVTKVGEAVFSYCKDLKSCLLPDTLTELPSNRFAGDFCGFFEGCSSLSSIDLPENMSKLDCGSFAFCKSLTEVKIPENVTQIDMWALGGCTGLTSIDIPDSVTQISPTAFSTLYVPVEYCENLEEINVGNGNENYSSIGGVLFSKDQSELIAYPIGKPDKKYTIPEQTVSIGANAFSYVQNLETIIIPDSVTEIKRAAFYGSSIKTITIPDTVTTIADHAFYDCKSLGSIVIPDSVTEIKDSAFNGSSIKTITIPDTVTTIADYAFYDCKSLGSIVIPDSVTTLGYGLFTNCEKLRSVALPDPMTEIGDYMFSGCSSLEEIAFPANLEKIKHEAFSRCDSLKSVLIPKSVSYIGESAFDSCSGLEAVTIMNPDCEFESDYNGDNHGTICNAREWTDDGAQYTYNGKIYGEEAAFWYAYNNGYDYVPFGDCNADTSVNIADAVILQKYLLGSGELTDQYAADLCTDGKINVFDMILMRQKIVDNDSGHEAFS